MVVSRGLGKFRLFNHREVILCTLTRCKTAELAEA